MVFEGTIDVNSEGDEGPLGEMHGYLSIGQSHKVPLLKVKAITHRKDAILPICVSGRAGDETHTIPSPTLAATMAVVLREAGVPFLNVALPVETMIIWAVVQVPLDTFRVQGWTSDRLCREIGRVLFASKPGTYVHKILVSGPFNVRQRQYLRLPLPLRCRSDDYADMSCCYLQVVGDDIDIYKWDDILWAYTTRCLPTRDEIPFEDVNAWVLLPSVAQTKGKTHGGKVVCNCILPSEERGDRGWEEADFKGAFPAEVQEKVLREWKDLGLR